MFFVCMFNLVLSDMSHQVLSLSICVCVSYVLLFCLCLVIYFVSVMSCPVLFVCNILSCTFCLCLVLYFLSVPCTFCLYVLSCTFYVSLVIFLCHLLVSASQSWRLVKLPLPVCFNISLHLSISPSIPQVKDHWFLIIIDFWKKCQMIL